MADGSNGQLAPTVAPVQETVEQRGLPTLFHEGIYTDMRQWPTNLNFADAREKVMAFNAGNPADIQLPQEGALRIIAHRFILIPEEREDEETSEVKQFATLVLFDAKGKTFKTSSAWAWRRAKAAVELFTQEEWDLGIPFKIQLKMSQRKRPFHDIRIELQK